MKKIESIEYATLVDEFADLSYIGTFDDKPKDKFAINHKERNGSRNCYEWFNPQPCTCENLEQSEQAYGRMMDHERGDWQPISIRAIAHVRTSTDGISWQGHDIESPGLWGIESDSDKSYLDEVKCDQFRKLAESLREFGFSQTDLDDPAITIINNV